MIVRSSVERQVQHVWGGSVAIYLFLGGVGAGAYAVAAVGTLISSKAWELAINAGLCLSFPLVCIGLLFLLSHLGSPTRAPLAGSKVGTSWISRGTWIFSIFIVVSAIHFGGQVAPADYISAAPAGSALPKVISVIGLIFALLTMLYTGALLSGAKGVPLWRTAVLPVLFMVSGLLTGLLAVVIGMLVIDSAAIQAVQMKKIAGIGAGLVVLELLVILFFLYSAYNTRDSKEAAQRIVGSSGFVFGDLILGLTVPLIILLVVYFGMEGSSGSSMAAAGAVAAVLGLIGGFLLRNGILSAGMAASLDMAGFTFRPVANPDFEHSPIGKLPPQ